MPTPTKSQRSAPRDAGACTCPSCGEAATFDLAPNPGPTAGGPWPEPFPPPEGVTLPEPEELGAHGAWYLVLCTPNPAHRTLVHEGELDDLIAATPKSQAKSKDVKPTPGAQSHTPPQPGKH